MGGLTPQQAVSLYESENPFCSADAYAHSNYSTFHDGTLIRLLDWREPAAHAKLAHSAFRSFVTNERFSCVGAKAAVRSEGYRFGYYSRMRDERATHGLARDLCAFVAEFPHMRARYKTFVAVFGEEAMDERAFERALWEQLEALHAIDSQYFPWDPSVSNDAADASFAFSFAGSAFFVVGLHPNSSRLSRRFSQPALAFNAHRQFRGLRETGHFERIQTEVRKRELLIQGNLNPNLAEFGTASEARQYSGRKIEDAWRCPFHRS